MQQCGRIFKKTRGRIMKNKFYVKKRTLLLIAGIVWLIAGFNVARLGVLSYFKTGGEWFLYPLALLVFCLFGAMFYKMSQKHTKRISAYESHRPFWHFFDLKAYHGKEYHNTLQKYRTFAQSAYWLHLRGGL